ncbi:MAG: polysulfide reductase NrfD [Planctomycetes bacterium]|nr:polysulfide reductase NrfD [Planctomycetota bacterium]
MEKNFETRPSVKYMENLSPGYIFWVAILLAFICGGIYAYINQFVHGLATTGLNDKIVWGLYIQNFAFFVGLSAGGVMVASLVYVLKQEQFQPIARIAEVVALICILMASMSIFVDLGNPKNFLFILSNFKSPIAYDVLIINVYTLICCLYIYFDTRVDFVALKDKFPGRKLLYTLLSLGRSKTDEKTLRKEKRIFTFIAFLALPAAFLLHSITAWVFGLVGAVPGWSQSIIAPIFIVSAMISGTALITVIIIIFKAVTKANIKNEVISKLGLIMACLIPIDLFFIVSEKLTGLYVKTEAIHHETVATVIGHLAAPFWFEVIAGLIIPLILLVIIRKNNLRPAWIVGLSAVLILAGVLAKRWSIVISSLYYNPMQYPDVSYTPTLNEIMIIGGIWSFGALLFTLAMKFFPFMKLQDKKA